MTPPLASDEPDTLPKLLLRNAARWPDRPALREKDLGVWHVHSWAGYREQVRRIALGLRAQGLARGEVVAIMGRNRPSWLWSEIAAHALGAMTLGIYEDVLAAEAGYLIGHARAAVIVCEDEEQVDKAVDADAAAGSVRTIVVHDPQGLESCDDPRLVRWPDLLAAGDALAEREPGLFEREVAQGRGEDVAILCTTSGTTSSPKLAMLQHGPFLEHIRSYLRAEPRGPDDEYVSILPLPWIMEQVYVVLMPLLCGIRVSFPESRETAMRDLREIGPTHVLLAPRVWEQTAADIRARLMDAGPFTRWLVDRGLTLAHRALDRGRGSRWAELLVTGALRDRLGFARVRAAATGGAALGPDTFRFFLAIGVPLRQLYGQTELAGAYTLQQPGAEDFDSSGVAFDDTLIRIEAPDGQGVGEIVARNPGMFKGYLGNEAEARATLTPDGWMRTGDAGFLDEKGRLTVIDRVRDLATTSAGIRFSPQLIENKLKFSPYIGEAVVLGHGRPHLAAILCIRYSMVAKWAEGRRIAFTTYQSLATGSEVGQLLGGEVEKINAGLPEGQRLHRFLVLCKELDPDDGELTRTRKVRRGVIDERYAELIEALYSERDETRLATEVTFEDGRRGRLEATLAIRDTAARRPPVPEPA